MEDVLLGNDEIVKKKRGIQIYKEENRIIKLKSIYIKVKRRETFRKEDKLGCMWQ